MKEYTMKTHSMILALVGLLLVACSSPVLAQSGLGTSSTSTPPIPTALPLRVTPQSVSSTQPTHSVDFLELGMSITLPPDWNILNQPGVVFVGPGLTADNSMERTWVHLSFNRDAPQILDELAMVMTEGMQTQGHINNFTTTRVVVGDYEGIAIWWTQPVPRDPNEPEHWLSIYVPANGLVHEIVFHPILLSPDGKQLKSVGQAILDSIKFFPTTQSLNTSQETAAKVPIGIITESGAPATYTVQVSIPPLATATPVTAQPRRIQFAPGAISATIRSAVTPNEMDRYVLRALAGQTMIVNVTSYELQMFLAIYGADGTVLKSAGASNWNGRLPTTQDYYLTVSTPDGAPASYTLQVTIPQVTIQ